jgi:hypothetical protein
MRASGVLVATSPELEDIHCLGQHEVCESELCKRKGSSIVERSGIQVAYLWGLYWTNRFLRSARVNVRHIRVLIP